MREETSFKPDKRPPNILVRSVARIGLSIRTKLLIAFVGITALMGGLALFGLSTLEQANARTEQLIYDQERFAFYSEIFGYIGDLQTLVLAAGLDPENVGNMQSASDLASGERQFSRVQYLIGFMGRGVRTFGGQGSEEGDYIWQLREQCKRLEPLAIRIRSGHAAANYNEVDRIAANEFIPVARRIQRDVFTRMQDIEAAMADTARVTTSDYLQSRQQVTGAALAAIGLALLMGYAMSASLIWPVRRVGEVLGHVAGGGFDARVAVPNRDEMGDLARDVNAMGARLGDLYDEVEAQKDELQRWNLSLEEKVAMQVEEIDRVGRLRRFLPAQVAELIVGGEDGANLLGTRRGEITVLFADLRGFTAFSNAMPPAQVIGALNAFHSSAGPIIEAQGGTIERFLGDGLMVLFGAPVAMEDAAQRAVDTGLAMRDAVAKALAEFSASPGGPSLGLGIGIGTGVATLGQIGFEGRQDYSAIGPAPNLAARLCDRAAAGQILIAHATAWQVTAEMAPVGPFDLKGIGQEVAAFEVKARAEDL